MESIIGILEETLNEYEGLTIEECAYIASQIINENMNTNLGSFGVTKARRNARKAGFDAYKEKMGHSNDVKGNIKTRLGMAMPSLHNSKRRAAKHAAQGAYYKQRSGNIDKHNEIYK